MSAEIVEVPPVYCCAEFAEHINRGFGGLAQEDGDWFVAGCCNHCCVIGVVRFCPFCGKKLESEESCPPKS
jgi:hypothetical protein